MRDIKDDIYRMADKGWLIEDDTLGMVDKGAVKDRDDEP